MHEIKNPNPEEVHVKLNRNNSLRRDCRMDHEFAVSISINLSSRFVSTGWLFKYDGDVSPRRRRNGRWFR